MKRSIISRRFVAMLLAVVAPIGLFIAAARATTDPAVTPTFANLSGAVIGVRC